MVKLCEMANKHTTTRQTTQLSIKQTNAGDNIVLVLKYSLHKTTYRYMHMSFSLKMYETLFIRATETRSNVKGADTHTKVRHGKN